MSSIAVDAAFPGGNMIVDGVTGDTVRLRQDLRDTNVWWFYWHFRVRGAAERTLKFMFDEPPDRSVFGGMGPCFSVDGIDWEWSRPWTRDCPIPNE